MNTAIQSGYKVRYKQWSDYKVYERIVEGAVKYKTIGTFWNIDIFPTYRFYNKKREMVMLLKNVEIYFMEKIFTTVLEEEKKSWVKVIIEKIKKYT